LLKNAVFLPAKNVRKAYANGMQSVWHVYGTFGWARALTFDATPLPFSRQFGPELATQKIETLRQNAKNRREGASVLESFNTY
jgi:hypothetical protein